MAAHAFIVFTNFYIISEAKLFTLYSVQRCTTFGKMTHIDKNTVPEKIKLILVTHS